MSIASFSFKVTRTFPNSLFETEGYDNGGFYRDCCPLKHDRYEPPLPN